MLPLPLLTLIVATTCFGSTSVSPSEMITGSVSSALSLILLRSTSTLTFSTLLSVSLLPEMVASFLSKLIESITIPSGGEPFSTISIGTVLLNFSIGIVTFTDSRSSITFNLFSSLSRTFMAAVAVNGLLCIFW